MLAPAETQEYEEVDAGGEGHGAEGQVQPWKSRLVSNRQAVYKYRAYLPGRLGASASRALPRSDMLTRFAVLVLALKERWKVGE